MNVNNNGDDHIIVIPYCPYCSKQFIQLKLKQFYMYKYLNTPWFGSTHDKNGDVVVRDCTRRIIANFQCDAKGLRLKDIEKNAILFAASPKLLAALEQVVSDMEEEQKSGEDEGLYEKEPRQDIVNLKELIALAKGE